MGNQVSQPGAPFQSKESTKDILNMILKHVFSKPDFVDMYAMADPEKCAKYTIAATDALDAAFFRLRLYPREKAGGEIIFERMSSQGKLPPNRKELCEKVAFFFVRIFQIFAALYISVIDTEIPYEDPTDIIHTPGNTPAKPARSSGLSREGFAFAAALRGGALPQFRMMGGALSQSRNPTFYIRVANYEILNEYLSPPTDVASRRPLKMEGDLAVAQQSLYNFDAAGNRAAKPDEEVAPIIFYQLEHFDETVQIQGKLTITKADRLYKLKMENIVWKGDAKPGITVDEELRERYTDDSDPRTQGGERLPAAIQSMFRRAAEKIDPSYSTVIFLRKFKYLKELIGDVPIEGTSIYIRAPKDKIRQPRIFVSYHDRIKLAERSKDIEVIAELEVEKMKPLSGKPQEYQVNLYFENLKTIPESLKSYIDLKEKSKHRAFYSRRDTEAPLSEKSESVPTYLKGVFEDIIKRLKPEDVGTLEAKGYTVPFDSKSIPQGLRVKQVWERMIRQPPIKAHCVARAIQLLNPSILRAGLKSDAQYSSICKTKFQYTAPSDGSLPTPGQPITGETGLALLEIIVSHNPRLKEDERYKKFRQLMRFYFEHKKSLAATETPESLSNVYESLPDLCEGKEGSRVVLKGAYVGKLYQKGAALLQRQERHLRSVMSIMNMLFDPRSLLIKEVALNARLLDPRSGGMDELNRIAEVAREYLTSYYGDCERIYREGINVLYQAEKERQIEFKSGGGGRARQ